VEAGLLPAEFARQLGVSKQPLDIRRKASADGKLAASSKTITPAFMELSLLRIENQRLRIENKS